MYVVWLSPGGSGGFTLHRHISQNAEICPGFLPPQTALRIILSNEGVEVSIDKQIDSSVCHENCSSVQKRKF